MNPRDRFDEEQDRRESTTRRHATLEELDEDVSQFGGDVTREDLS